jgi:ADP-ribose pyrophosphatase YjhB (NUDIX family)
VSPNPPEVHPTISRREIPAAASSARLDRDLVARLMTLDAENRDEREWHASTIAVLAEAGGWLLAAAAIWALTVALL